MESATEERDNYSELRSGKSKFWANSVNVILELILFLSGSTRTISSFPKNSDICF